MFDALPIPRLREKTPEKQISELMDYLLQFKEALEFILINISEDNLSPELRNKLDTLVKAVEENGRYKEEELAQIAGKNTSQGG